MNNVFDPAGNATFISRINKLSPDSSALWGKMNVAQMLAHCQVLINMALGNVDTKRTLPGYLFGRMAKKQVMGDKPFSRNLPTIKEAKITSDNGFDAEKAQLITLVTKLASGSAVSTNKPHPFFGVLNTDEWDRLNTVHLDHHLNQFGV